MRASSEFPPTQTTDAALLARRIERLTGSAQAALVPALAQWALPLQDELLGADTGPLLRVLQDARHAVGDAQYRESLPRWLRWLGATRGSGTRFQSDCRDALAMCPRVAERVHRLVDSYQPRADAAAGHLDALASAADGLCGAVEEAQGLLLTLWEGLRPQRPDPDDPGSLDTLRAVLGEVDGQRALVQRLDTTGSCARDVVRVGRAVLAGRREILALVDARYDRALDEWRSRVHPLLREEITLGQLFTGARNATAARRGLLLALDQMRTVCTRLQIDEQALAHALGQLHEQLASVRPVPDRLG